jgi:hypothetical protein
MFKRRGNYLFFYFYIQYWKNKQMIYLPNYIKQFNGYNLKFENAKYDITCIKQYGAEEYNYREDIDDFIEQALDFDVKIKVTCKYEFRKDDKFYIDTVYWYNSETNSFEPDIEIYYFER